MRTSGGAWKTILHAYTGMNGSYTFPYKLPRGDTTIRVETPATTTTGQGASKPLTLRGT
jgi:hypothetical protein